MAQIKREKPKNAKTTQRSVRPKAGTGLSNQHQTEEDLQAQLNQAALIESLLEKAMPAPAAANESIAKETFFISAEQAQQMTGCAVVDNDQRRFLEWFCNGVHSALFDRQTGESGSASTLEALRGFVMNSQPRTPIESMLLAHTMVTSHLAMAFSSRTLRAQETGLAIKLANQFVRLANLSLQQAETIRTIRGEAGKQTVTVHHMNLESGAKAVLGTVNAAPNPGGDL